MSINQTDTVDVVSTDEKSGDVLLTITDHLEWNENEEEHLLLLQEKINSYLRFIESGELCNKFPKASGRNIVINVVGRFPLSERGNKFFNEATAIIRDAGFSLRFNLFHAN
jgi:hypothetical protein